MVPLKKVKGIYCCLHEPISELWSITCHMGWQSVTWHPTQVNVTCLNPQGRLILNLPTLEVWKGELTWVVGYAHKEVLCP